MVLPSSAFLGGSLVQSPFNLDLQTSVPYVPCSFKRLGVGVSGPPAWCRVRFLSRFSRPPGVISLMSLSGLESCESLSLFH